MLQSYTVQWPIVRRQDELFNTQMPQTHLVSKTAIINFIQWPYFLGIYVFATQFHKFYEMSDQDP